MKKVITCFFMLLACFTAQYIHSQCEAYFTFESGSNGNIFFNNQSVPSGPAASFLWVFGDGSISDEAFPQHQYDMPGAYNVCLYLGVFENDEMLCSDVYCTSVEVSFESTNCPFAISSEEVSCGLYYFHLNNFGSQGNIVWNFGDGTTMGGSNNVTHLFENPGLYEVCAQVWSAECPQGVVVCTEVLVAVCETPCPTAIVAQAIDCDSYLFYLEGVNAGDVVWQFGDNTMEEGGVEAEHTYNANGSYTACAFFSSPGCPDGVELCTTIVLENCIDCNLSLSYVQTETQAFTFTALGAPEALPMYWNFGDGTPVLEATWVTDHVYQQAGLYNVCIWYISEECGVQEACIAVQVGDDYCPTELIISDELDCHQFIFSVNNIDENENPYISWDFGDTQGYGFNHFLHMYLYPGEYEVCASGATDACQGGYEVCTTLLVEPCGGDEDNDGCPDAIWGYQVDDCGLWNFEAGSMGPMSQVVWNWGDGTENTIGTTVTSHQFEEDGIYIITLTYYSPECGQTITLIYTVQVNACEPNPCDLEIWSGEGEECGWVYFEAGSYVEEEEFTWYFGDGTQETGGHFITHYYSEPGIYVVQCVFSNINCPGGQEVITIEVEDCEEACTEIVISLDSYIQQGGPNAAWWWLENELGQTIDQGVAQYSNNDPYYDELMCLTDGCYSLEIEGPQVANAGGFQTFLTQLGETIPTSIEVINDNLIIIHFGINTDCSNSVQEQQSPAFMLYPNPACQMINIYNLSSEKILSLDLMDATGRIVMSERFDGMPIQIEMLPSGCYMVKVTGEKNTEVVKLNIEK